MTGLYTCHGLFIDEEEHHTDRHTIIMVIHVCMYSIPFQEVCSVQHTIISSAIRVSSSKCLPLNCGSQWLQTSSANRVSALSGHSVLRLVM